MLKLSQVHLSYGRVKALNGLDLHIEKGKIYGFVGPNGAGKTTTMKVIAGLLQADQGEIFIDGVKLEGSVEENRKVIGYMPDFFGVYDNLLVSEYLQFFGELYDLSPTEINEKIDKLLALVQLEEHKDKLVDSLSRGMKQRLCLARALIHDPKLLLLDEPASGMDPVARMQMKHILKTLSENGQTILISSHILPELSEICDEIGIIDKGKMIQEGNLTQLDRALRQGLRVELKFIEKTEVLIRELLEQLQQGQSILEFKIISNTSAELLLEGGEEEARRLLAKLYEPLGIYHFAVVADSLEELFKKAIAGEGVSEHEH